MADKNLIEFVPADGRPPMKCNRHEMDFLELMLFAGLCSLGIVSTWRIAWRWLKTGRRDCAAC